MGMITSPNWVKAAFEGGKLGVGPVYLQFPGNLGAPGWLGEGQQFHQRLPEGITHHQVQKCMS